MSKPVRVRFAPSPTGYLHVGGARSSLYNYLFAKKMGGSFILRIEDTDVARSTDESLRMVMEDLQWLGQNWDEGPDPRTLEDRGSFGPYRQSQRMHLYKKYAEELLKSGKAYHCFMTDAEIEAQREALQKAGKQPHVESPYADWTPAQAEEKLKSGAQGVVRFRTKHLKKDYVFRDIVRGEVRFPSDMVADFVLLRTGGMPVYNFCNVIDDHLMEMTHVLRAEEHLPNTLRQLMLYEAFGWTPPEFGHLSLILDEDRKKLSKRKGATSCHEFKNEGYLPEALNNFIALLGWSHPEEKELLSMDEMVKSFSLDRFTASGAVFDAVKLKWVNANHLRALPSAELWKLLTPFFGEMAAQLPQDPAWRENALAVFKPRMETLAEATELFRPLADGLFKVEAEAAEVMGWETSRPVIQAWVEDLRALSQSYLSEADFNQAQDRVKERTGAKGKHLFQPIRIAIIGKPQGADLKLIVPLIERHSLIRRAETALA